LPPTESTTFWYTSPPGEPDWPDDVILDHAALEFAYPTTGGSLPGLFNCAAVYEDVCERREVTIRNDALVDWFAILQLIDAARPTIPRWLAETGADLASDVARGAAVVEIAAGSTAFAIPITAPVTGPLAAKAGAVSATASGVELVLGLAIGDEDHARAGGFGVISYGFSRHVGIIARGMNVTARQAHAIDAVTAFYSYYGSTAVVG
jgi:hypothetical protein